MNVTAKVGESRKLLGLLITIGALLLALAVFIVCSAFLGTPWDQVAATS